MRFSKLSYKELLKIFQNNKCGKILYDTTYKQKIYFNMNKLMDYTGEIIP